MSLSGRGGTGRRNGLKIRREQSRAGSIPAGRTMFSVSRIKDTPTGRHMGASGQSALRTALRFESGPVLGTIILIFPLLIDFETLPAYGGGQ